MSPVLPFPQEPLSWAQQPREWLRRVADSGSVDWRSPEDAQLHMGIAEVHGARTLLYSSDWQTKGGALDKATSDELATTVNVAADIDAIVGCWRSGGARLDGGSGALDGAGAVFASFIRANQRVPHVSLIVGPVAGAAAYGPALTDVRVFAPAAQAFVTGPRVVEAATGDAISADLLGGAKVHARESGFADVVAEDDVDACRVTRRLVAALARTTARQNPPPSRDSNPEVPASRRSTYDVRQVVREILDDGPIELQPRWAPNLVTFLGRIQGYSVGCIANNPSRLAGCLDARAAEKGARFVSLCDRFRVPILTLVDTPGYLPGVKQEQLGVLPRGATLLRAFCEASVPRVSVVLRKAYGGAYIAMNSHGIGADAVFAWPDAEIGVMAPETAVHILHGRELAEAAARPATQVRTDALIRDLATPYAHQTHLASAIHGGSVDAVIRPSETRAAVAAVLLRQSSGMSRPSAT